MYELVQAVNNGIDPASVPGIRCVRNGQTIASAPRKLIENIDDIPPSIGPLTYE